MSAEFCSCGQTATRHCRYQNCRAPLCQSCVSTNGFCDICEGKFVVEPDYPDEEDE